MTAPPLQYQCLHCGGWYLFQASADRCPEKAIPAVQAESAEKREHWERYRRIRSDILKLPTTAGARGPLIRGVK